MRYTADKRAREKILVSQMIALYCRKKHRMRNGLCPTCQALTRYAEMRSDKCPFMATKTFCSNCTVRCYQPEMREKMREVMRFFGSSVLSKLNFSGWQGGRRRQAGACLGGQRSHRLKGDESNTKF